MKTAKLTLMFLACAAAIPAFAQNTTDSACGMTNFDRNGNRFTIVNPASGMATQQCFITVVPKQEWTGGAPDPASSQFVEGNYQVALSGGGGGGGGGAGSTNERKSAKGGDGGSGAVPAAAVRYLKPGVYRLTIGSGGQGGASGESNGGRGEDGAPTSLSNADTGETVAGFPNAENWNGSYAPNSPASHGAKGPDGARGGGGAGGTGAGNSGSPGGNGFIRLALADPVQPARMQSAPAPAASSQAVTTPPPAAIRPARRDRN